MTSTTLLALVTGCTIPIDVGSDRVAPRWAGVPQDVDGDGVAGERDCDDRDPRVSEGAVEICDDLDNDCDGWTDEGDVCLVTEAFPLRGDLDVLLVVDARDEAFEVRQRFLDVLPAMLAPVFEQELSTQIAVVGANPAVDEQGEVEAVSYGQALGEPFVRSWTTDASGAVDWVAAAIDNLVGDGPSRALDATLVAIEEASASHETFDRPRAALAVIFVTPLEDASSIAPDDFVVEVSNAEQGPWQAHGLVTLVGRDCEYKPETYDAIVVPPTVRTAVELTGGLVWDRCRESYDALPETIAPLLLDRTARREYLLGHPAQSGSMRASRLLFGNWAEEIPDSRFVVAGRVLTFLEPLPVGGELQVRYDLDP